MVSKQYIVAAGSYFSSRDSEKVQTSSIHQADNYGYLLIIVLEKEFQFSRTVQPVCIDWDGELKKENDGGYVYSLNVFFNRVKIFYLICSSVFGTPTVLVSIFRIILQLLK